ncbi:glycoside hydrolase family 16 protein [Piloderma croceum F 1598]|uniref:Glycoside hydrolase family 16 protein n=1 Tax=Piloderma croceum (strain F 1598) TaxID=765440 RepID=A0A0C3C1A4_PILCF|nr:glycoside hydrolase family 16 protein [Piloderma croceum F 1598]
MHIGYAAVYLTLVVIPATCARFRIADTFKGRDFFDGFNWETLDDPTDGRVNFVDKSTAMKSNLSFASADKFIMRADHAKVVSPDDRGRDSVRITSQKAWDDSTIVLDLSHMPEGCATWPAFWTLSQQGPWPHGGEVDVIEGVNLQNSNLASLHTTPDCIMDTQRPQSGSTVSTDCDATINNNQGCGTQFTVPKSYGTSFNNAGGGWYAMQKTAADGISVWFWSRMDPDVPAEVRNNNDSISPKSWGMPSAWFPSTNCDYASHFNAHEIIFDLTFCGDWANSVYPNSGCGGDSCTDFVNNNPSAFTKAYWEVNSLRVYTT